MEIYFDNAATTPLSERAAKAYIDTSSLFPGNPSSIHRLGMKAKDELERRRKHMASLLAVDERNLIFSSGATESISPSSSHPYYGWRKALSWYRESNTKR